MMSARAHEADVMLSDKKNNVVYRSNETPHQE